jgi:hypothetical protein
MKIILRNIQLTQVNNACCNASAHSSGIKGALRMKLDAIIQAIAPKQASFQNARGKLIEEKAACDAQGNPKTKLAGGRQVLVFSSEEDEKAFLAFDALEHTFDIELLSQPELAQLVTEDDPFGGANEHFQALKKVTDCFAQAAEAKPAPKEGEDQEAASEGTKQYNTEPSEAPEATEA